MSYLAIKDLKNTRALRERLEKEKELILTKDGQPFALIIGVTEDNVEISLREVRRAMFSKAVAGARNKSALSPIKDMEIDQEIKMSRKSRGIK